MKCPIFLRFSTIFQMQCGCFQRAESADECLQIDHFMSKKNS